MSCSAGRMVYVDQTRKSNKSINAPESDMEGGKDKVPKLCWGKRTPAP